MRNLLFFFELFDILIDIEPNFTPSVNQALKRLDFSKSRSPSPSDIDTISGAEQKNIVIQLFRRGAWYDDNLRQNIEAMADYSKAIKVKFDPIEIVSTKINFVVHTK